MKQAHLIPAFWLLAAALNGQAAPGPEWPAGDGPSRPTDLLQPEFPQANITASPLSVTAAQPDVLWGSSSPWRSDVDPGGNAVAAPIFEPSTGQTQAALTDFKPSAGPATPTAPQARQTSGTSLSDLKPSDALRFPIGGIVQATFDSNVFIQRINKQSDSYFTVAPLLAIGKGDFSRPLAYRQSSFLQPQGFQNADLLRPQGQPFFYLSYIPSYTAFINHTGQNSVDHDAGGEFKISLQRLTLGALARYQTFRLPETDVGNRVVERLTSAEAYASYAWSPKTQLSSEVFLQNHNYQALISSFEIWNEDWLDYHYSGKTDIGAGIALGMLAPSAGPTQYYGRVQARGTWSPTGKLFFVAKGGVEMRGVNGAGNKAYPVFGLEGRYAITSKTFATLSIYQQIRASAAVQAINYIGRGGQAGIESRILDRFTLELSVGYINTEYDDALGRVPGGYVRTDNYFYAHPALRTAINQHVNVTIGLEYRNNDSSQRQRGFNELLSTFELDMRF